MSLLSEFRFPHQSGGSVDGAVTATLNGVTAGSGAAVPLPGWDGIADAIALDGAASISVPATGVMGVELALQPGPTTAESFVLLGSGTPLAVSLTPAGAAKVAIAAAVRLADRTVRVEATQAPIDVGTWASVSVAFTGDELVVAIGGALVARRVLRAATPASLADGILLGANEAGPGMAGHLAGLRLWDALPDSLAEGVAAARSAGVGEIESRWDELGGGTGWIGNPTGDEVSIAAGRARTFQNAAICWSPDAGTFEVHGAIRGLWEQLGGAAGFLGFPISDELDADAFFDAMKASKITLTHHVPLAVLEGELAGVHAATHPATAVIESHLSQNVSALHGAETTAAEMVGAAGGSKVAEDLVHDLGHGLHEAHLGVSVQTPPGNRLSRFQGGIIAWSAATGAHESHGDILVKWLLTGGTRGFLGLPTTDEHDVPGGRENIFTGGSVLWSAPTGAFEVHGAIRGHHQELGGSGGWLGFPLTDETDVFDEQGHPTGGRLNRFQAATMYWSPATGPHEVHGAIRELYEKLGGPRSELGYPTTDETGVPGTDIRFNDFEHGVIVWKPDRGAQMITTLTVQLDRADAPSIDDGVEFLSADHDAEMYTFTTVRKDGQPIGGWDNRRIPPGDAHGGKTIEYDHTPVDLGEIRSATRLQLNFRARDWDQLSSDDDLGGIDLDYGIESWWGTLDNGGIHRERGTGGDGDVFYSFSIGAPSIGDPGPAAMREKGWWSFSNFKSARLDRALFTETFLDVEADESWWDTVTNPLDSLFFEVAYKGVAKKGNCFGMSQEARRTVQGHSAFREPVSGYTLPTGWNTGSDENKVNPLWRHFINRAHGEQLGAAVIGWMLTRLTNLEALSPLQAYAAVRGLVRSGDRPVISMLNLSDFAGHAVLAYDIQDGNPNVIWVCDPNVPFGETADRNVSRIEIHPDDTFQFFNNGKPSDKYRSTTLIKGVLPGTLMTEIPSAVLDQPVRTPFWDIASAIGHLIGGLILLGGDGDTTQITGDGNLFYGDPPIVATQALHHLSELLGEHIAGKVSAGQLKGFTSLHSALGQALAQPAATASGVEASQITTAAAAALGQSISPGELATHQINLGLLAGLLYPHIVPNRIPGMARMPFLDVDDPPELYAQRGALPNDIKVEWAARGTGAMQAIVRDARTAVALGATTADGERGTFRLEGTRQPRPLLHLESNQTSSIVTADYVVQEDRYGREARRLRADLPTGSTAPTTFGPAQEGLGIVIQAGVAGPPVNLRIDTLTAGQARSAAIELPGIGAAEALVVRPEDPASPLGNQIIDHTAGLGGVLLSRSVVSPTG